MSDSEVVYGVDSPLGNASAQVEDDGRVVYLYLSFQKPGQEKPSPEDTKVCWVRNRGPAPETVNEDEMEEGIPPMMPREYCLHPNGSPPLDADQLNVVWFEEGNGVALKEGERLLAIVPPWSGLENFYGYSSECVSSGPFASPLAADNVLHERIEKAEEYWCLWDDESFWDQYASSLIKPLEAQFGPHTKYYAIDGDKFPPKAMLRFDLPDRYLLITVGVSLLPQPNIEMAMDDPSPFRRIELAAAINKQCPIEDVKRFGSFLSGQSQYPWKEWSWLGAGHTVSCKSTPPSCGGNLFPSALLSDRLHNTPQIDWPQFRGDPINLLWFLPITAAERELAVKNGSDDLIDRFIDAGIDVTIRNRREVNLF